MFGTSTYSNTFSCMMYMAETLTVKEVNVDVQLDMAGCTLHVETVAFDRLSYLFDIALTDSILINRSNKDLAKVDALSYNKLVYCFGEPVDSFIAMMLYQKLVAILGEHAFVESISLEAIPGAGFKYTFASDQIGATILPGDDVLAKRNLVPFGFDKLWYYRNDLTVNDRLIEYSEDGVKPMALGNWNNEEELNHILPPPLQPEHPDAIVLPQDGEMSWESCGMGWKEAETESTDSNVTKIKSAFKPTVVK